MSQEIQLSASLSASKNGVAEYSGNQNVSIDMSGADMVGGTQAIGTSTEQVTIGDVGTVKYVFVRNLDAANFVELGLDTPVTQIFAKLLPGEIALWPPKVATFYAKADTAEVVIQKVIVEA